MRSHNPFYYAKYLIISGLAFCSFTQPMHPTPRKGKDFALFFAVNQYQSSRLTTLENPIADAKGIAEILKTTYGFDTKVVENPTYEIIEKTLAEYSRNFASGRFDKDGQLLIFF